MTERIALEAGSARAEVLPGMGAALGGVWLGGRPVLRPWSGNPADGPFAAASNVLAPVSNRVSRPFAWQGTAHALPRNLPPEPFPIHGDAFQRPWAVLERAPDKVVLGLDDGAFGPLRYAARLACTLAPGGLRCALSLTSRAEGPMPFGLGFHPWFPRDADTRLAFAATGVWAEDACHLPAADRPGPIPEGWRFDAPRALPGSWINNGFAGWNGVARIVQGPGAVSVTLRAGGGLDTLIVYSPGAEADFFCAEPVSHPVDALNLPGRPGLAVLAPGETLRGWMTLDWQG